jgi:hypothetical protein
LSTKKEESIAAFALTVFILPLFDLIQSIVSLMASSVESWMELTNGKEYVIVIVIG